VLPLHASSPGPHLPVCTTHRWLSAAAAVGAQLSRQAGTPPPVVTWTAPAWPSSRFQPNFRRWQSGRGNALRPLPPPSRLPPLPDGIDPGGNGSLATQSYSTSSCCTIVASGQAVHKWYA
jgi:hypothetical protein